MTRRDDVPYGLEAAMVPVSRRAIAPVPEGPLRTAGRAYVEPAPPDELHLTWRPPPQPGQLVALGVCLLAVAGMVVGGAWSALLIAVPVVYVLAAKLLNRTTMVIGERDLRIRHRPVPWPGKRLRRGRVVETIVQYFEHHKPPGEHWSLVARMQGGDRVELHRDHRPDIVYAIARLIDEQLGLEDADQPDDDEP